MGVCKIAGAFLLLAVSGIVTGFVPAAFWINRRGQRRGCLGFALLAGTGLHMLCFAILMVAACLRGWSFLTVYRIYGILFWTVLGIALALVFCIRSVRELCLWQLARMRERKWLGSFLFLAGLYVFVAATYLLHRPLLENFYDLPERLSTMQGTNLLSGIDPLTGNRVSGSVWYQELAVSFLPAWYLFFMRFWNMELWDMLFKVVPLFLLLLCMSAYYEIGTALFGKDQDGGQGGRTVSAFLLFFVLFTICGNDAYMNPSYGLLHYAYEESTWIGSVLLPCVFALVLGSFKGRLGPEHESEPEGREE